MAGGERSAQGTGIAPPNIFDRLVGYFSPGAAVRRTVARTVLQRAYAGASPRDGWRPARPGASANTDHQMDAAALRVRARALVQNSPYIAAAIEALESYTIGTGISPRSLESADRAQRIDSLWDRWTKEADADGLGDFHSLMARAYRAMEVDGEVLIRIRPRTAADGLSVPMQLQLLEIDWLDSSKNGNHEGRKVINGVAYSAIGRVDGYYLYDEHPGELLTDGYARGNTIRRGLSRFVPATRVIHLYRPERPGQGRGFSRLAPVITRVRDLELYMDAEAARKNLESRLGFVASGDLAQLQSMPEGGLTEPPSSGNLGQLASGGITAVPAGMNLTAIEPKAVPGFTEYVSQELHLIASGIGVPYESMTGDMSGVNFSSARIRRMDFKKSVEKTQWLLLIPQLLQRVRAEWYEFAALAGALPRGPWRDDWSTPKWEYVNPQQDVAADAAEIAAGLSSFSEKLRQRGYKPDLVFGELKSDLDRLQKDGVYPLLLALKSGNAQAAMDAAGTSPSEVRA
jgi:lambda family phage portal protein